MIPGPDMLLSMRAMHHCGRLLPRHDHHMHSSVHNACMPRTLSVLMPGLSGRVRACS